MGKNKYGIDTTIGQGDNPPDGLSVNPDEEDTLFDDFDSDPPTEEVAMSISPQDIAAWQYFMWEKERPPHKYPNKEACRKRCKYIASDESVLFEIERIAFSPDEIIPPPYILGREHKLWALYYAMKSQSVCFDESKKVSECEDEIAKTRRKLSVSPQEPFSGGSEPTVKDKLKKYYHEKKLYLERSLAYLYAYLACPDIPEDMKTLVEDDMHKIELTYVGHQIYSMTRSCAHSLGPLRKSGEIMMHHVYGVAVQAINRCNIRLQKVEKMEIDPNEKMRRKREIYKDMKIKTIAALTHDILEDFKIPVSGLRSKMCSMTEFDLKASMSAWTLDYEDMPDNLNFIKNNEEEIVQLLIALRKPKKPENGEDDMRIGYLKRQIDTQTKLELKIYDRMDNIKTLKYMRAKPEDYETSLDVQCRKLSETFEILQIGQSMLPYDTYDDLHEQLADLCEACFEETERLLSDDEYRQEINESNKCERIQRLKGNFNEWGEYFRTYKKAA